MLRQALKQVIGQNRRTTKLLAFFFAALMGFIISFGLFGCGDDSISGELDLVISYLLTTPISEIDEGETAVVEVKVADTDGVAQSGKMVTFTCTPSSLGYFTPSADTTGAGGVLVVVFTAAASGTATLQASVSGATQTTALLINDIAVSSGNLELEVTPILMLANGTDSADVLVTATNNQGDPVEDGTIIYLTAGERFEDRDSDGYWTDNIDSLLFDANSNDTWDPIGIIPSTVTTTNGTASTVYRTGNQATSVYIRATMIGETSVDFAEVSAKLNPNTTVASITLTHSFEDLRVRGVGGIEWTTVTATAYDVFGNKVPEGIEISFTIASGPGGGENIQAEGYGPVTVYTNSLGQASVTVYSGTISGTIKMRATSGSVISAATQLVVNAGPPAHMTVGVQSCNVRSWDRVNEVNYVSAQVNDIWGNPVPDSTVVWFSTEEGMVIAHSLTGEGTPKGIAESSWYSGNPRDDGIVYIYACTDGGHYGELCDTVAFISSGMMIYINVIQWPATLVADGEDKGKVIIDAYDINYNFMVQGTPIDFETDFGSISGGGIVDGCHYSIFETRYTSEVLKKDYSPVHPDDGIGVISRVDVRGGGMGGPNTYFTTQFLTGNTYVANSSIDIDAEIEPNSTVPFVVSVRDRPGNPLGGHALSISVSTGMVSDTLLITSEWGEINLFYTAPGSIGACIITVTDNDPRGGVSFARKVKIEYEE